MVLVLALALALCAVPVRACVLHALAGCVLNAVRSDAVMPPSLPDRAPNNCPNNMRKSGKDEQTLFIFSLTLAPFLTPVPCPPRPTHRSGFLHSYIESTCGTDTRSTTSARASLLTYSAARTFAARASLAVLLLRPM